VTTDESNIIGGCEHLPDGTIITYARCWSCQFGSHYDAPKWHGWADAEDIEHAEKTGQDVEAIKGSRCACECARAERPAPELTPAELAKVTVFGLHQPEDAS
jgi:hypothetical protein